MIEIEPAVVNSSCAWASDYDQLLALYQSPYTGAVTTRTSTLNGFNEDPNIHTVAFAQHGTTSANSYGYSPYPLSQYISWIQSILTLSSSSSEKKKPFIISLTTSTPTDLSSMFSQVQLFRKSNTVDPSLIAIELNTSCPNIPGAPPSAYIPTSGGVLASLLAVMRDAHAQDPTLVLGIKLPPYVYTDQFVQVIHLLKEFSYSSQASSPDEHPIATTTNPFSFLTCTNTLGNSLLLLDGNQEFALPTPLGGLAGDAIHALALGNVYTFRQLLSTDPVLKNTKLIGVGGVTSKEAAERMRKAGADVVGCATLLGKLGVKAFEVIAGIDA